MEVSGVKLHHCHSQEVPLSFVPFWWKESGFQDKRWPTKSSTRCRSFRFFGFFFSLTSPKSCLLCSSVVICLSESSLQKEVARKELRRGKGVWFNCPLEATKHYLLEATAWVQQWLLSPGTSLLVILKPLQRRFLDLKHVTLFLDEYCLTEHENEA